MRLKLIASRHPEQSSQKMMLQSLQAAEDYSLSTYGSPCTRVRSRADMADAGDQEATCTTSKQASSYQLRQKLLLQHCRTISEQSSSSTSIVSNSRRPKKSQSHAINRQQTMEMSSDVNEATIGGSILLA